jgi:hypothetical protein
MFVLAFLCFNAGGIFCLAYCQTGMKARVESCPLAAVKSDCPHSKQKATVPSGPAVEGNSAKCFVLPIGIFSAPVDGKASINISVAPVTAVQPLASLVLIADATRQLPDNFYRPPPNDRRVERVRNQVFRI